jgi:hypothetical protein
MPKSPDANEIHRTQGIDALRQAFDEAVPFKPKIKRRRANGPTLDDDDKSFGDPAAFGTQTKSPREDDQPPATSEADYGFTRGQQQESRGPRGKFEPLPLTFYRDLKEAKRKDWNIKNVMACGEVSSWFGPPGSGKSAILTDIAIAGASNQQWRGYRIKENFASVYFALERSDLVKRRHVAHRLRDELLDDLPIAISGGVIGVMSHSCVDLVVDAIKRTEDQLSRGVGLGIFDTWGKAIAAGGGDEQQAKDQNIALSNMRRVLDKVNIHIATIGHTGKDESRGERGSNAKQGDIDLEVQISGEGTIKSAVVTKANDQPLGPLTSFQLEPFNFGLDEDGDPFRTYIVAKEIIAGAVSKKPLSDKQQLGIEALAEAILKHGIDLPASYRLSTGLKSVTRDQWQAELYRLNVLDREAANPTARFSELRQALQRKHVGARISFGSLQNDHHENLRSSNFVIDPNYELRFRSFVGHRKTSYPPYFQIFSIVHSIVEPAPTMRFSSL